MASGVTFAGQQLKSCIFNASGPRCVTEEELLALAKSDAGAVLSKSCTVLPREGNPEPRYYDTALGSINSMGLPNLGYTFYGQMAPKIKAYKKPYFVSVSGLTKADNVAILSYLLAMPNIDAFELNLSCPNIVGKPQVGYDMESSDAMLAEAKIAVGDKPLGVKLPPYFDFVHFEQMAAVLNKHTPAFITCINSIGNGLVIDVEKEQVVIKPKGGFGGIGGDYVKPTALANVRKFRELLNPEIQIVGCGGIKNGSDVFEYILAGADAVQVGTALMQEGPGIFHRLNAELEKLMKHKGYSTLNDFRNKLKVMG